MVAVWVILAHGCHDGDHDDELAVLGSDDRSVRTD